MFFLCGYVLDTALSSCCSYVLFILKCSFMVQRTLCEALSGSVLFWNKWLSISDWNLEFWKSKSSFWLSSFSSVPKIHLIFFRHVINFLILGKLGKEWLHTLLNQQMYWCICSLESSWTTDPKCPFWVPQANFDICRENV